MRWLGLVVAFLAALQSPAVAAPAFEIRLSSEILPETAYIEYGLSNGKGLAKGNVLTFAGLYSYRLRVDHLLDPASRNTLKVLIYVPGYQIVASEFEGTDLTASYTFYPQFIKAPSLHIRGVLVNSSKLPVPDCAFYVTYWLGESNSYFGPDPAFHSILTIATVQTGSDGYFETDVPNFREDPFIQKYNRDLKTAGFILGSEGGGVLEDKVNPILLRTNYDDPVIVITSK